MGSYPLPNLETSFGFGFAPPPLLSPPSLPPLPLSPPAGVRFFSFRLLFFCPFFFLGRGVLEFWERGRGGGLGLPPPKPKLIGGILKKISIRPTVFWNRIWPDRIGLCALVFCQIFIFVLFIIVWASFNIFWACFTTFLGVFQHFLGVFQLFLDPPSAGPPKNFAFFFFPSSAPILFSLSLWGLLVEFWWCF